MSYEEFKNTIAQVLVEEEKFNLKEENISIHLKGEIASEDDEKSRLWIQDANKKYYQKESDILLGDFLAITMEHTETMAMVIRYDLESLYNAYCSNGWELVFANIEDQLNMCRSGQDKLEHITEYEKIRDWLVVRPVNFDQRRENLQRAVYKRIGDIALGMYILLYEDHENYNTCPCYKEIIENWNVPEEEMWETAMRNTMLSALPRMFFAPEDTVNPPYNKGAFMAAGVDEDFTIHKEDVPVVTTTRGLNGAIAMFYPGVQERISELAGGDYYVAFTSIDSAMIHPVGSVQPRALLRRLKILRSMVPEGFLSKNVYKYNFRKKELEQLYL